MTSYCLKIWHRFCWMSHVTMISNHWFANSRVCSFRVLKCFNTFSDFGSWATFFEWTQAHQMSLLLCWQINPDLLLSACLRFWNKSAFCGLRRVWSLHILRGSCCGTVLHIRRLCSTCSAGATDATLSHSQVYGTFNNQILAAWRTFAVIH